VVSVQALWSLVGKSQQVLKYALVQPAEGRASWETGFLRCTFLWQSVPVKGFRKLELAKDFFVCFLFVEPPHC